MTRHTLHTERLILRPPAPSDAADIHRLAGDRRIAGTTSTIPHPYKRAAAEAWIRSLADGPSTGRHTYALVLDDTLELIGVASLTIERERPIGNLGYWVGVPYWNHGYATEAARELIRYGFVDLELVEIQAIHMTRNPASGRVLAKVGMEHCGSSVDIVRGELEPVERFRILPAHQTRRDNLEG